ncbi:8660_t:CDS:2 [Dentiscutata erythropus]|uniref:8660_t:CDS:1 n=1 Tax=Dentiscutata erythropus TaxID=1348616 RepID=A0A9N9JAL6_9GLOM|nr:8660_t:CDS:2 [Dentiscutata erythropus]
MSFLSCQAKKENKEQDFFLNILRGSKKGKGRTSPYPKESLKKIQRKSISIPMHIPEGSENAGTSGGETAATQEIRDQCKQQNEIIQRLGDEITNVRKLLEKGGVGDYMSTDEFITIISKIEIKGAGHFIMIQKLLLSKRGAIADKIQKVIFTTFEKKGLPKITTKFSADAIKSWKESYEIRKSYQEFNDDQFSSQVLQRSWSKRPSEEQLAFTIFVIKYIFNPNIYSIQIKDEYICHYMKKY